MTEDPSAPRRPEGTPKPQRTGYPQMRPAQGYQVPGRAASKRITPPSGQPRSQAPSSSARADHARTTQLGTTGSGDDTRIITTAQPAAHSAGQAAGQPGGPSAGQSTPQRAAQSSAQSAAQGSHSAARHSHGEQSSHSQGAASAATTAAFSQPVFSSAAGGPGARSNETPNEQVYNPSDAWANAPADNSAFTSTRFEARDYNAAPVPDPTYAVDDDDDDSKKKKRSSRRLGPAGVVGVTLVTILVLILVGFGSYVLGSRAGHAEGYQRGYSEGSSTVARSADDALQKLNSISSSSSSVSSSLAAMLPAVNPCSEKYGQREAAQTTWGRYGWGCKFTSEKGHKFSVLIGEADRDTVGKPRIEKRRNGQTKGCIATGSPQSHPAFGLTVWVAEAKGLDSCKMAKDKWNEVAKSS